MTQLVEATTEEVVFAYDYSELDDSVRERAKLLTLEAKNFERRSLEAIVGFGKVAAEMQEILPHGKFIPWLESEFNLSQAMAYNFINVAKQFGNMMPRIQELPITLTVLYQIAEPNAPTELREAVLENAESGKKMSVKEVKDLKKQLKEAEKRAAAVEQELEETEEQKNMFEDEVMELLNERDALQDKIHDLENNKAKNEAIVSNLEKQNKELFERADKEEDPLEDLDDVQDKLIQKRVDLVDEIDDLELKLREMRRADKELSQRIASKEKQVAAVQGKSGDQQLLEKKLKLEAFRRKVVMVLSESAEEELLLSVEGMDDELSKHYSVLRDRFDSLAETCEQMLKKFAQNSK